MRSLLAAEECPDPSSVPPLLLKRDRQPGLQELLFMWTKAGSRTEPWDASPGSARTEIVVEICRETALSAERRPHSAGSRDSHASERAIINASLWAAAGDALGWMTELAGGPADVQRRTGKKHVTAPVGWRRLIGGRRGVTVYLPAGTYSDDTQLRLCVSRSIRGDGSFDIESFARIELTAWQAYALGAGIGSMSAAASLSEGGVSWFSNFFQTYFQAYATAGGNGAAMRIQPHVWATPTRPEVVHQVLRNSLVTHGHPHGFCGAVFHALCLFDTLSTGSIPGMQQARDFVDSADQLQALIEQDAELGRTWLPTWENEANQSFADAITSFRADAHADIQAAEEAIAAAGDGAYPVFLDRTGLLSDRFRGSGFKTALAALVLSSIYGEDRIEEALIASANELDSDTDTIATMAGAILGSMSERAPTWHIQDRIYLEGEARRLAAIRQGRTQTTFSYPDISSWQPPASRLDAVVRHEDGLALAGLGPLLPRSEGHEAGDSIWQWFELPFGQTVFAQRRAGIETP